MQAFQRSPHQHSMLLGLTRPTTTATMAISMASMQCNPTVSIVCFHQRQLLTTTAASRVQLQWLGTMLRHLQTPISSLPNQLLLTHTIACCKMINSSSKRCYHMSTKLPRVTPQPSCCHIVSATLPRHLAVSPYHFTLLLHLPPQPYHNPRQSSNSRPHLPYFSCPLSQQKHS